MFNIIVDSILQVDFIGIIVLCCSMFSLNKIFELIDVVFLCVIGLIFIDGGFYLQNDVIVYLIGSSILMDDFSSSFVGVSVGVDLISEIMVIGRVYVLFDVILVCVVDNLGVLDCFFGIGVCMVGGMVDIVNGFFIEVVNVGVQFLGVFLDIDIFRLWVDGLMVCLVCGVVIQVVVYGNVDVFYDVWVVNVV